MRNQMRARQRGARHRYNNRILWRWRSNNNRRQARVARTVRVISQGHHMPTAAGRQVFNWNDIGRIVQSYAGSEVPTATIEVGSIRAAGGEYTNNRAEDHTRYPLDMDYYPAQIPEDMEHLLPPMGSIRISEL